MSRLLAKLPSRLSRPTTSAHLTLSRSSSKLSSVHPNPSEVLPPARLSYSDLITSLPSLLHNASLRNSPITPAQLTKASELASLRLTKNAELNTLRHTRGLVSEEVRLTRTAVAKQKASAVKTELKLLEDEVRQIEADLLELVMMIPNSTHPSTPLGPEENAVELERIGPVEGEEGSLVGVSDPNRDHLIVGRNLGVVDFESGRLVAGAGFYFLRKEGVVLSHALVGYALDLAMKAGFEAASTPDVVRTDIGGRCGFVPREREGAEDASTASSEPSTSSSSSTPPPLNAFASSASYHIAPTATTATVPLSLAGTAEIPLAGSNLLRTFFPTELPHRTVGVGKAYRTEAGSAESRGLYRVHQFEKVELFVVCEEKDSEREMERLRVIQRALVRGLGLGVRVLDMPTEELGAAAYRKYDMEAWMPGRGSWGEISSTSNCTDYQSRRLHISYRTPTPPPSSSSSPPPPIKPTTFAHTLNGTAAAIPRLIVALLENGVVFNTDLAPAEGANAKTPLSEMGMEEKYQERKAAASEEAPVVEKKKSGKGREEKTKKNKRGTEGEERKETLDEGLEIVAMRLPEALKRFWIGPERMGGVPIEWV